MCMWESRGAGFPQEKIYIKEFLFGKQYSRCLRACVADLPNGCGLGFFFGRAGAES